MSQKLRLQARGADPQQASGSWPITRECALREGLLKGTGG